VFLRVKCECRDVARNVMAGDRHRAPASAMRGPKGSGILLLMVSAQLVVHVAGSTLCDRCETDGVRALRRYYLSLNLSSVYLNITQCMRST